jgi:uncharacterized protein
MVRHRYGVHPGETRESRAVKLSLDNPTGAVNAINGYAPGQVRVNTRVYSRSVIVTPQALVDDWPPQDLAGLTTEHVARLAELDPEIVLIGTGESQRFPPPAVLEPLLRRRIGIEVMDTAAACRTYNIVMAEGRQVAAALFMIQGSGG